MAILCYFLLINVLGMALFALDKYKARRGLWRIPESTLLLVALIGGSVGALLGMKMFHHKTRHLKFSWGIPLIIGTQIGLMVYYFFICYEY